MVLWATIVAAFVGWVLAEFEVLGGVAGAVLGAVYGWGARRAVRAEVEAALAPLNEAVVGVADRVEALADAMIRRGFAAAPPADTTTDAPVPAPAAYQASPSQASASALERTVATGPRAPETPGRADADAVPEPFSDDAPFPDPAPPADPEPRRDPVGSAMTAALAAARGWLLGGNTIVRLGLVILFVGLSFLASYAASAGLFPVELRLALVAAVGIALLVLGFRARERRPGFGTALQGAGVAVIYLTLFAAARLTGIVPTTAAFALMAAVCALGCALALLQRSQPLAATAFAGGYAVPILLAEGGGAVAALFAYYTVLNLAVLFLATRRAWRVVNLIGFVATFGVAGLWIAGGYPAADFAVTQIFVVASVLIYVAAAVLYGRRTPGRLGGFVDTTLLFGPALAGFGLEVGLVGDRPFGAAFAALGFAALYLGVALVAGRRRDADTRLLNETLLAVAVGFVTLAVPLALGARWTSATWALEGAGVFWVGARTERWVPRLFGLGLQGVAALLLLAGAGPEIAALPFTGPGFVGSILVAVAALFTAWRLRAPLPHGGSRLAIAYARGEAVLERPVFLGGFLFWWLAWATEAHRSLPPVETGLPAMPVFAPGVQTLLSMLAFVASAWVAQAFGRRRGWTVATWPSRVSLAALLLGFVASADQGLHVLSPPAAAIWAAAIGLHLHMLRRNDRDPDAGTEARMPVRASHVGGTWLAVMLAADMLWLAIDRAGLRHTGWAEVVPMIGLAAVLAALTLWTGPAATGRGGQRRWPLDGHATDYAWFAAAPLAVLLVVVAALTAMFSSGAAAPLPFVPLLNPVDLGLAVALAVLLLWARQVDAIRPRPAGAARVSGSEGTVVLAALAFLGLNTAWLRATHHLLGVAWSADALLDSFVVQAGLAILWTLVALGLMVAAHRRGRRTVWMAGAALLAATVVKLLLVDLNNANGAARVVVFIAVGVLMLVVGYLAPLPPRRPAGDAAEAAS